MVCVVAHLRNSSTYFNEIFFCIFGRYEIGRKVFSLFNFYFKRLKSAKKKCTCKLYTYIYVMVAIAGYRINN